MKPQLSRWTFEKFGTQWAIDTPHPLSDDSRRCIAGRLEQYDKTYSRFRDDSLVAAMQRQAGTFTFPRDFAPLYKFYQKLYQLTDGRVTPLVGRMLEQAGYGKGYSLQPQEITAVPKMDDVITWDGDISVRTTEPVVFDVGAAGKGYAVDLIAPFVESETERYVIDASGDIRHRGQEERVGLEHPYDTKKIIGTAKLQNQSLCASASNRRSWHGMHHIIDPIAQKPVDHVVATWAIADSTLHADGLATALFFADASSLLREFSFEFVRMFADGSVDYSPGFEGELFT